MQRPAIIDRSPEPELPEQRQDQQPERNPAPQSRFGLNVVNFFLAEVVGVVMPFVNDLLRQRGWSYQAIGAATALAGLGVFLMQTPAGYIVDRISRHRGLLAGASLVLGLCYGLLPLVPAQMWVVDLLLFTSGVAQAFFTPLLGALALALVGHARLSQTMGANQSWNHAGNIAAAVSAMVMISWLGLSSIFYNVMIISWLAAILLLLIRPGDLRPIAPQAKQNHASSSLRIIRELFRDRRVVVLFAATALFHLANAPVMPLVALYVKHLKGSDIQVAAVVLVAQAVMVPVALAAGWLCNLWGRKLVFTIGFVVLPVRIFLYSLATTPNALIALQSLDGIGAGIYGVAVVAVCADLTRGKEGFNTLCGMIATALALGGVIGPLSSGWIVYHLGFNAAFYSFAAVAAVGAALFVLLMPETKSDKPCETEYAPSASSR